MGGARRARRDPRARAARRAVRRASLPATGTVAVMDAGQLTRRRGARAARVRRARRPRGRRRASPAAGSRTLLATAARRRSGTTTGRRPRGRSPPRRRPPASARADRRRRPLDGDGGASGCSPATRARCCSAPAGRGRIALLADTSPLQNRLLDEADNAALRARAQRPRAADLRRERARLRPARGLAALPARFGWALIGLLLAALVFMVARGRRLGPPEPERRDLPPPRRAYVDALAATMARGKEREAAVAPVRAEARRRLARRAGTARRRRPRRGVARGGARRRARRRRGARAERARGRTTTRWSPPGGRSRRWRDPTGGRRG